MPTKCFVAFTFWVVFAASIEAKPFKAATAEIELPLPTDWSPDENSPYKPRPTVNVRNLDCVNSVEFDYIPAVSLEYSKRLVETQSLQITTRFRQWNDPFYSDILLSGQPVSLLSSSAPHLADDSFFLIPARGGVLIIHVSKRPGKPAGCLAYQLPVAATVISLFFATPILAQAENLSRASRPPALNPVEHIPSNLEECFVALEKRLSKEVIASMRSGSEEDMIRYHHGLGTGLRNYWGLWTGSPLARSFNLLGVYHPDNMSGIILQSFWRHLNDKPILLEEQAAMYRK